MQHYLLAPQAHRGFLRAFNSITNITDPKSNIAAAWTAMTGVPAASVTKCGSIMRSCLCMTIHIIADLPTRRRQL